MKHVQDDHKNFTQQELWCQHMWIIKDGEKNIQYWSAIVTNNTNTLKTVVLKRDQHKRLLRDLDLW